MEENKMDKVDVSELFWSASVEDMQNGYVHKDDCFICLICGECFEDGVVYQNNGSFFEAEKYAKMHMVAEHQSVFEYLINLDKKYTGLSDIQKEYLVNAFRQCSDRDIANTMGCSESAVRNQRFKLREKAHQAKVFLAIAALIDSKAENNRNEKDKLVTVHKRATTVDLRYAVTQDESQKIIANYFDDAGHLKKFPVKEKKKIVVLRKISGNFSHDKQYSEAEINRVLERIYDDYATIRRELIEYGFMDRTKDCSRYWIKE